jgi:cytochrome c-type biogenesis protein CcmH/NrfG
MRMRQSLAEIERAFVEEAQVEQVRAEYTVRTTELRARQRKIERAHKHGTKRFVALVVALVATAVLVTVAMFETLYYVMS